MAAFEGLREVEALGEIVWRTWALRCADVLLCAAPRALCRYAAPSSVGPEAAALVGASDLDPAEIAALERHPILRLDASEMQAAGVAERWEAALGARSDAAPAWYLHLDLARPHTPDQATTH